MFRVDKLSVSVCQIPLKEGGLTSSYKGITDFVVPGHVRAMGEHSEEVLGVLGRCGMSSAFFRWTVSLRENPSGYYSGRVPYSKSQFVMYSKVTHQFDRYDLL